ncbi:hypothetical protein QAD02_016125 [Eretmocerus hayati]|uniref:Uncharacterized protein n=1 Tax=Eretmocerus hayati TaxID=131215 RepID=A0ACC2PB49_9HYME|nr:hypothetical protein QAD02_016125 [Eretmocerus hayati]
MLDGNNSKYFLTTCNIERLPEETYCNLLTDIMSTASDEPCKFKIKHHEDQNLIFEPFSLKMAVFSGTNEALIQWKERNRHFDDGIIHNYAAILAISSCKMEPLSYTHYNHSQEASETFVDSIIYASMFDLIISDPNRCDGLSTCKISFDTKGTQVGRPISFPVKHGLKRIMSASPTSPSNGLFLLADEIVGKHTWDFKYMSGSGSAVKDIFSTIKFHTKGLSIVHSNANRNLTICGIIPGKIHCEQYKLGAVDSAINFTMEDNSRVIAVHSLSGGGFLILSIDYEDRRHPTSRHLYVTKIDTHERVKKFDAIDISLDCGEDLDRINIVVNDRKFNSFCFHLSCASESLEDGARSNSTFQVSERCIQ